MVVIAVRKVAIKLFFFKFAENTSIVIIIRLYLRLRISFVVNSSTVKQVYGDPILTADVINNSISYSDTNVVIHTGV